MNRVSQCINRAIFIFAQKSQSSSRTIKLSRDKIISRRKLNQHLTLFERNIMNFIENFEQGCISFYMCIIYFFIFFSIVHKRITSIKNKILKKKINAIFFYRSIIVYIDYCNNNYYYYYYNYYY